MNSSRLKIFFALCALIWGTISYASVCEKYVGHCDYYLCKEQEMNCGPKGYLINYGHRYCSKFFAELEENMSPDGKLWIQNVGTCLQENLETIPTQISCNQLKKFAFHSHSDCYLKADFCHLPFQDKLKIIMFLKVEFFKYQTQKEGIQVLFNCAENK